MESFRDRFRLVFSLLVLISIASFAPCHGELATQNSPLPTSVLDENGRLNGQISPTEVVNWKSDVSLGVASSVSPDQLAQETIWLGEYTLAHDENPEGALALFAKAQQVSQASSAFASLAAFDAARALYLEGAYGEAADAFGAIIAHPDEWASRNLATIVELNRQTVTCQGYHAQRERLGIPEPTQRDPECAAAALASSLRALGLPYGKADVLPNIRVTGFGSNSNDVVVAGKKLGLDVYTLSADDQGLVDLPKPLVAHVEHDHFISVTSASKSGVTYLCSDCGPWPGGFVTLTWRQWHALEADTYQAVVRPGTPWDTALEKLTSKSSGSTGTKIASIGSLSNLGVGHLVREAALLETLIKGHVIANEGVSTCAFGGYATKPPWFYNCPCDKHRKLATKDPVDLASGEEEYVADDIDVYNPHGPSVQWGRVYDSLREVNWGTPFGSDYEIDDFGYGWSNPYNYMIQDMGSSQPAWYISQVFPGMTYSGSSPYNFYPDSTSTSASPSNYPTGGDTWDVINTAGTIVASNSSPGGQGGLTFGSNWGVVLSSPFVEPTVPSSGANGNSYEIRTAYGGLHIQVASTATGAYTLYAGASNENMVPNGPASGTLVSGAGAWELDYGGSVVSTGNSPNGWSVYESTTAPYPIGIAQTSLTSPLDAPLGGTYVLKFPVSTYPSISFTLTATQFASQNGYAKCLIFPNGAQITFNAATVPSATTPAVPCTFSVAGSSGLDTTSTLIGIPYSIQWNYQAGNPFGTYTVTGADRSKLVIGDPFNVVSNGLVTYAHLIQQKDIVGNTIDFNYSGSGSTGFPLLASITDASTGSALLTLARDPTNHTNLLSVTDKNGRIVYYHWTGTSTSPSYPNVDYVSQLMPPSSSDPYPSSMRYAYSYVDPITSYPMLGTISVPSPTGTGTSTATINYGTSAPTTLLVTSAVDANGNKSVYTYPTTPSDQTEVQVENSSGTVVDQRTYTYNMNMETTAIQDGDGNYLVGYLYGDTNAPYSPSDIFDGNQAQAYAGGNTTIAHTKLTHDTFTNVLTSTSARGTGTTYTYQYDTSLNPNYPCGLPTEVQDGSLTPVSYTYDSSHSYLLSTVSGPIPGDFSLTQAQSQILAKYSYDTLGDITEVQSVGPNTTSALYSGTPGSSYSATTFTYGSGGAEAIGEPLTIADSGAAYGGGTTSTSSSYTYDTHGNVTSVTDANGNATTYNYKVPGQTYTLADQLQSVVYPATGQQGTGNTTLTPTYLYPDGPEMSELLTDEAGNKIRSTSFLYGDEGEDLGFNSYNPTTSPATVIRGVSKAYDAEYRITGLTQHKVIGDSGQATSYSYIPVGSPGAGRLYQMTYPLGDNITYSSYDEDSNVLTRVDGRGVTTNYTYSDPESLLTQIAYTLPSGAPSTVASAPDVNYTYDAYGRIYTQNNGVEETTFGNSSTDDYDDDGNPFYVIKTYDPSSPFNKYLVYYYNPDGSLKTLGSPCGNENYGYNGFDQPLSFTDPFSNTSTWTYGSNLWTSSQTLANGVKTAYTYTALGDPTDIKMTTSGGTTLSEFSGMTYDGAGDRTYMAASVSGSSSLTGNTTYTYDYLGELLTESSTRNGGYSWTNTYDAVGNDTELRNYTQPTPNADNQEPVSGVRTYDGDGNPTTYANLATGAATSVTYDPENRLTQFGSVVSNTYDSDSLRASKTNSSGTTYYFREGDNLLDTLGSTGGILTYFSPFSYTTGGVTTFYTFDPDGNAVDNISSSGTATPNALWDAYGDANSTPAVNPSDDFDGADGDNLDLEMGLMLLDNRYYDETAARFLNRDPSGYGGGLNEYEYADDNPVNESDPSGLDPDDIGNVSMGAQHQIGLDTGIAQMDDSDDEPGTTCDSAVNQIWQNYYNDREKRWEDDEKWKIGANVALTFVGPGGDLADGAIIDDSTAPNIVKGDSGGRLGSAATRAQIAQIADILEKIGWTITGGGGRVKEEFIPNPWGGRSGSSYADITAEFGGAKLRINTVDTNADGTVTARELENAYRIQGARPGDTLWLIAKK